jgi:hypothetical protein
MFQMILIAGLHAALPAGQRELNNEFEKQSRNRIDQRSRKNTLGGIIPVGVDIKGE